MSRCSKTGFDPGCLCTPLYSSFPLFWPVCQQHHVAATTLLDEPCVVSSKHDAWPSHQRLHSLFHQTTGSCFSWPDWWTEAEIVVFLQVSPLSVSLRMTIAFLVLLPLTNNGGYAHCDLSASRNVSWSFSRFKPQSCRQIPWIQAWCLTSDLRCQLWDLTEINVNQVQSTEFTSNGADLTCRNEVVWIPSRCNAGNYKTSVAFW